MAGQALGAAGESVVAAVYEQTGWTIVARNWRCREGEVDLIVRRGGTVVFCEVKTRTSDRYGSPAEAVGPAKQQRLRRLASVWLTEHGPAGEVRFDVAAVRPHPDGTYAVELLESAF